MKCKFYKEQSFDKLLAECKEFYKLPGCISGGPLHILLDEDNFDDDDIIFCIQMCARESDKNIKTLGLSICHAYLLMSNYERAAFDWYWNRSDLFCKDDSKCGECYICNLED